MASKSLRRYDVQAKVSLLVTIAALIPFVGMVVVLAWKYDPDLGAVIYGRKGLVAPVFLLGTAATMLLSFVGTALGFNSAGQRRNDLQRLSWTSFFSGIAILAGAIICFAIFWFLKMPLDT